ncbi:uncharacterized protein [Hyperolius riggenbachi]|uniref:uncharacterized protein isoform X2 n=1 Tax=Hyperolius riggenbachi TaxID=752182 RepID=UPI0035A33116
MEAAGGSSSQGSVETSSVPSLSLKTISLRKAMALLGTITSSFPAIQWGQLHSRSLQSWILSKWDKHLSSLDKRVMIPWSVKQSLLWWTEPQHLSTGNLWEFPTQYIITTDASSWGWGAHLDSLTAQGQWSSRISNRSSNSRELQAVWEAILAFKIQIWKTHVTIRTDNSTVVAYINHQGGTRSKSLQQQASRILHWAERSLKSIKAVHLKGTLNCLADYLSRCSLSQDEWSLNDRVFHQLTEHWIVPQVDLFARKSNAKCRMFCSLCPQDEPWVVDAFSISWSHHRMYIFPPLHLISRVLNKIYRDQAEAILIVPFWPKRPWFALLQRLATDHLILPDQEDLLTQGPAVHPNLSLLHLSAWSLNGEY